MEIIKNYIFYFIVLVLLIIIFFKGCGDKRLENIQNTQIRNQVLIEELEKNNSNILDSIHIYMKKDGTIVNNYKTYIQQYEKDKKIFDTTSFTNNELDSLFTNWQPE